MIEASGRALLFVVTFFSAVQLYEMQCCCDKLQLVSYTSSLMFYLTAVMILSSVGSVPLHISGSVRSLR